MYSKEHKSFLKRRKREKILVLSTQIFVLLFFITVWQMLADFKVINTFIFSSPKNIFDTIINLHNSNNLYNHIYVTMYETVLSFILGTLIGLIVATLMWKFNFFAKVVAPYLTILNSLPKVALGPIIIIWAGANTNSIILMALLISVIITIINIYQGFINTDGNKLKLMKSFNARTSQIFFKLILPANIPTIISTVKINFSLALTGVIMGELLTSKEGIGYLIMYGSQVFNLNLVMTGIILLGIVAALIYYLLVLIEKKLIVND